jgi:hypothetical protein
LRLNLHITFTIGAEIETPQSRPSQAASLLGNRDGFLGGATANQALLLKD